MAAKLKVFRTAVGFRDAYVAAPSKAAALRAWGTDKDLFARGAAELVTDEALAEEPLTKPGEVVYRTRGGLEEQIAALGKLPDRKSEPAPAERRESPANPARKPRPRPSRAKLEAAEQALAELENEREEAEAAMRERERALAAEREAMEARFAQRAERLKEVEGRARDAYQAALRKWEP